MLTLSKIAIKMINDTRWKWKIRGFGVFFVDKTRGATVYWKQVGNASQDVQWFPAAASCHQPTVIHSESE